MTDTAYLTVPTVTCENGISARLGDLIKDHFQPCPVFIITDKGLLNLGLLDPAIKNIVDAGFEPIIYSDIVADPPEGLVLEATEQAKDAGAKLVIGFGGGSSMDVAKLVATLITGEQELETMYGVDNVTSSRVPLIQVPTTAGTGAEVTPNAIITTGATTKAGVVSPVLMADMAVLDAALTTGLPRVITAATGIDAMVHAIEAYTSKVKKNDASDAAARKALKLLSDNLLTACNDGENLEARRAMLMGAMLAGEAFTNAPVAAVHALAYPIGGHFHVSHGLSNALVLPHVLRFNAPEAGHLYAELADYLGIKGGAEGFIAWLEELCVQTGIERKLRDVGITEDDIAMLAGDAMRQTRLLVNNPREMKLMDAYAIYEAAW